MAKVDFSTLLSADEKKAILEARIAQFANEGYQHTLNLKTLQDAGDEEGVAAVEAALATISSAIEVHQTELDSLEA